ncbi:MAG: hypothetical protein LBG19_04400 [Prevotellaceae bacterium]|jgi:Leucine-rich repeat (LRR) protein|nr:hypothetical protein [Prevotellaceae bacterium]
MKKLLPGLAALMFLLTSCSKDDDILPPADYRSLAQIPDPIFREYCRRFDTDGDGFLSEAEISNVTVLIINNMDIRSLEGVEVFTEIEHLSCHNNRLAKLDVSKNRELMFLYCYNNQLKS